MTDAEIRAVEEYLAELADVTLAPQTREEALTVLRRPATPATDLNVTEDFQSYADIAAVVADSRYEATSSLVTLDASKRIALAGSGGPTVFRAKYRTRVGVKYRLVAQSHADSDGTLQIEIGTSVSGTEYGTGTISSSSGLDRVIDAVSDTFYVEFRNGNSGETDLLSFLSLKEIPRTTAVYDMLNEDNMTDSEGGTQALDAGVEILLPSVADDPYGPELVDNISEAADWTPNGTNTVSDVGGAVRVTCVDSAFGAQVELTDAGGLSENLESGALYALKADVAVIAGGGFYLKVFAEFLTAVQDCTYFLFGFLMMNLEIQIEFQIEETALDIV